MWTMIVYVAVGLFSLYVLAGIGRTLVTLLREMHLRMFLILETLERIEGEQELTTQRVEEVIKSINNLDSTLDSKL